MLRHATLDQLEGLRLHGMAKALAEQLQMPKVSELSFEGDPIAVFNAQCGQGVGELLRPAGDIGVRASVDRALHRSRHDLLVVMVPCRMHDEGRDE